MNGYLVAIIGESTCYMLKVVTLYFQRAASPFNSRAGHDSGR